MKGGRRTIGKNGITIDWVNYIAPEMGERIDERVEVRLDPADPARLFVFALDGTFLFMAEDPERSGADPVAAGNPPEDAGCDQAAVASHAKASAKKADGEPAAAPVPSRSSTGPSAPWTTCSKRPTDKPPT